MPGARFWTERIPLRAVPELRSARLREPHGADELALDGVDTGAAVALLDRLTDGPSDAGTLAATDRDALLAALHRGLWGDRIVAPLDCAACGAAYDLSFELSALQRSLEEAREPSEPVAERTLEDAAGRRYRLPDAAEENAAADLGPAAGRARLSASIAGEADDPALEARLEALAPIIDVDLDAPCAECGHGALVRFDIQSFVLQRLLDERDGLIAEVHALAGGYGWSLHEIVALPRSLRRAFAERLAGAPAFG
jgi:hypothetical protein